MVSGRLWLLKRLKAGGDVMTYVRIPIYHDSGKISGIYDGLTLQDDKESAELRSLQAKMLEDLSKAYSSYVESVNSIHRITYDESKEERSALTGMIGIIARKYAKHGLYFYLDFDGQEYDDYKGSPENM